MNSQLHEDVVSDILMWLPVLSLLRFRSVCKKWAYLIDSSYFISNHMLGRHQKNQKILAIEFLEQPKWWMYADPLLEARVDIDIRGALSSIHHVAREYDLWGVSLVGCCNGIICLQKNDLYPGTYLSTILIWNPATKEVVSLPSQRFSAAVFTRHGFGYAQETKRYKVVRISNDGGTKKAEAFELKTSDWKQVGTAGIPSDLEVCDVSSQTAYLNGIFFWLIYLRQPYKPYVLSFDLSKEVFHTISMPESLTSPEYCLTLINNSISCIAADYPHNNNCDIWVLDGSGVNWTWIYGIQQAAPIAPYPVASSPHRAPTKKLLLVDPYSHKAVKKLHGYFIRADVFKESLVTFKK